MDQTQDMESKTDRGMGHNKIEQNGRNTKCTSVSFANQAFLFSQIMDSISSSITDPRAGGFL